MKKQIIITLVLLIGAVSNVSALEKYVTDDARIYLRRGPSTEYAFSGSVKSGEKVKVLEVSSSGRYTRIEDATGRISWILSSDLSEQPGAKERLALLEEELEEYKKKVDGSYQKNLIDDYTQKLQIAEQKISDLMNQNDELQKQVRDQSNKIDSMVFVVDEKKQSVVFKWFLYGGILGFGGIILGLFLPIMAPSRRKERWMH